LGGGKNTPFSGKKGGKTGENGVFPVFRPFPPFYRFSIKIDKNPKKSITYKILYKNL